MLPAAPEDVAVRRTPLWPDLRAHANPSHGAGVCATARPESGQDTAPASTRRRSWLQDRRSLAAAQIPLPRPQRTGPAVSANAPPTAPHSAHTSEEHTSAPSWRPSLPWPPLSLDFPRYVPTRITSEPACL